MSSWLKSKGLLYFVRLSMMVVLTAFNFWLAVIRWGWADTDPINKSFAVLVAGSTEIALFAFLVLFHLEAYSKRRVSLLLLSGGFALGCVAVSLYVNIGYFAVNWRDTAGSAPVDLGIRAFFPMALLLGFSMIPPRRVTVADIENTHQVKAAEIKSKIELEEMLQNKKIARRQQLEAEKEERVNMRRIAGPELTALFTTIDSDDNEEIDWKGLKQELYLRGQLSPGGDSLPSIEAMIKTAKTPSAASIVAPTIKRRGQHSKGRMRRTSAEISAITEAYIRGEYIAKSRQERRWLMQRAGVNKTA